MGNLIKNWLARPEAAGIDLDDPRLVTVRRGIIQKNRFLRQLYGEWYRKIQSGLPAGEKPVLELGSGAGFMREWIPGLLSSDVLWYSHLDLAASGLELPFGRESLRGIVMTDVLHHIPDAARFFAESARCICPGGAICMIEPWNTPWARYVYTHFHHEAFEPDVKEWAFPSTGPLSSANDALPWIIFKRDREAFLRQFPQWRLAGVELTMPVSYLISGGVSYRNLLPAWTYPAVRFLEEKLLNSESTAMFAFIQLIRNPD